MNNDGENAKRLTDTEFLEKITVIDNPRYNLDYTHTFKKSVKAGYRSNRNLNLLLDVVTQLVQTGELELSCLHTSLRVAAHNS